MAGTGQNLSLGTAPPNVCLRIRKPKFEANGAAQDELFATYISLPISKRKKLTGSYFVAL